MGIIEATKQAIEKGCCIKHESWEFDIAVLPTDICYELLMEETAKKERRPSWNPQTDDILADDWSLVEWTHYPLYQIPSYYDYVCIRIDFYYKNKRRISVIIRKGGK